MIRKTLALTALLAACGDNTELSGTITATVYGEAFIEEGIPDDVFVDGWAVHFDKFLISIGDPKAKAGERGDEVGDDGIYLVDLAKPSNGRGFELATFEAPAGHYDHYGYRIRPDAAAINVNVDAAEETAMKQAGFSMWLRGTATKDQVTKTLDWGFTLKLAHGHCAMSQRITDDAVEAQATIHADHFFYDDAVSDEPAVAFDLIASADADADNTVTLDELAGVDIRGEERYQVGSNRDPKGNAIENLRQYLELQATTLGHFDGEGHCEDSIVEP